MSLMDNPLANVTSQNPLKTAIVGAAIVGVGTGLAVATVRRRKKARKKTTKRTSKKRTKKRTKKNYSRPAKSKRWYGKTRSKKIKYTKNGQPYVILQSGKARFIKRGRAKVMRKRKGGYE